ncbi:dual specificity protein phosphatase 16 [Hoplias malabaricus]|uniref:dual specificity protein phosphatase 16 n=1 Tax=Hoplias malabaricus TaxID=27720 RepID=UPI003461970D
MVFCRDQPECAPLSRILPQLYLGAERDITQDCLSAQGISYVLSVSRCCPQPSFLPQSQYLRIPIDDSLRDELLPWIPQALRFIDGAMSLGCSVIVHCAAGISRSPALAIAYVMYSLRMDLDQAYRFVKERRPTISPNFNFLGQLQLFQGTLPLKSVNTSLTTPQTVVSSDTCQVASGSSSPEILVTDSNHSSAIMEDTKAEVHCENKNVQLEAVLTPNPKPEFMLPLSEKLKTLSLSLEPVKVRRPALTLDTLTPPKPAQLQLPSLLEKRKSLTLSLTPVCPNPSTDHKEETAVSSNCVQNEACRTPDYQKGAPKTSGKSRKSDSSLNRSKRSNSREASSRSTSRRRERSDKRSYSSVNQVKEEKPKANPSPDTKTRLNLSSGSTSAHQQEAGCVVEAVEAIDIAQSPLSPINLTINRLLGWGERMLLGVLLGPHIKVGQAALPYRC